MLHPPSPLIPPIRTLADLQPAPKAPIDLAFWPADLAFGLEELYRDIDEFVADLRGGEGRGGLVLEGVDRGVLLGCQGCVCVPAG